MQSAYVWPAAEKKAGASAWDGPPWLKRSPGSLTLEIVWISRMTRENYEQFPRLRWRGGETTEALTPNGPNIGPIFFRLVSRRGLELSSFPGRRIPPPPLAVTLLEKKTGQSIWLRFWMCDRNVNRLYTESTRVFACLIPNCVKIVNWTTGLQLNEMECRKMFLEKNVCKVSK